MNHFKYIPNYENLYKIDTEGLIIGIKRGKALKPWLRKGYSRVKLFKNGKFKNFDIHRLVALTFIPNPREKPHVMHLDDNPENNCVSNLKWCTHLENMRDMYSKGRRSRPKTRKVVNLQTGEIFNSAQDASKVYFVHFNSIRQSCNTKWKAAGYNWDFFLD